MELVDGDAGRQMLRRFVPPLDARFADPLADVDVFARVAVPAKYLIDAEQEGLGLIDVATAWLTTRLRYSWLHTPEQRLELYEREPTLTVVERLPGVAVFPVEGAGRRCWRDTTDARREQTVELAADSRWLAPPMPTQASLGDNQALLALQRAITARHERGMERDANAGVDRPTRAVRTVDERAKRNEVTPKRRPLQAIRSR